MSFSRVSASPLLHSWRSKKELTKVFSKTRNRYIRSTKSCCGCHTSLPIFSSSERSSLGHFSSSKQLCLEIHTQIYLPLRSNPSMLALGIKENWNICSSPLSQVYSLFPFYIIYRIFKPEAFINSLPFLIYWKTVSTIIFNFIFNILAKLSFRRTYSALHLQLSTS